MACSIGFGLGNGVSGCHELALRNSDIEGLTCFHTTYSYISTLALIGGVLITTLALYNIMCYIGTMTKEQLKKYSPAKDGEMECARCGSADLIEHSGDIDSDETVYWYECKNCGLTFD